MSVNKIPYKIHHEELKKISPAYRFNEGEDFAAWQKKARARLVSLLGLEKITPPSDDMFQIEYEVDHPDFTEYRIIFQSEEGYFVPCNLRVPKGKEGKIPMIVCLQGHATGHHISLGKPIYPGDEESINDGDRDFAVQIVREGYCALAIEQRGFGECGGNEKGPQCLLNAMSALLYGRTILGERVFDISRAIDVITKNFSVVDADAIACMGNSGGGTATFCDRRAHQAVYALLRPLHLQGFYRRYDPLQL